MHEKKQKSLQAAFLCHSQDLIFLIQPKLQLQKKPETTGPSCRNIVQEQHYIEHRAQECQSCKCIHGDRHLETNFLTFIHQRKRPPEAKGLVQFYTKFHRRI